ncbi:MAG: RNA polymerase sigma factor [Candidatus Gribaldobacteria bacterium]|nr:RNA polymerase sigma factor [Candidatus Gribaldobacteria bacterium]
MASQTTTDEQITQLVQKGDNQAFGFLVEKYEASIKRYARKFTQDPETINDITQTVFLKAFSHINSFNAKLKFSSWLYRIAHNELVNFLKKKKELPLFDFDTFWPHSAPGKKELENETEKIMMRETFEKCLAKIPAKYKEVINFYYLEDLSYEEIANILRIPISTIGVRLKRGKTILRKLCHTTKIYGTTNKK